jgi:hypothetical protein
MRKIFLGISFACGLWMTPTLALACESPTCPCHHKAKAGAPEQAATGDRAKAQCSCTSSEHCPCASDTAKSKKPGTEKVGFNLHSGSHTVVARDASAGLFI